MDVMHWMNAILRDLSGWLESLYTQSCAMAASRSECQALLDRILEEAEEAATSASTRFQRQWYWTAMSILTWGLFWRMADQQAENRLARFLAWLAILVAVMVASTM